MVISHKYIAQYPNESEKEFEYMASLAQRSSVGIVEIGVFRGRYSVILAANASSDVPVWGIDPIVPDSMGGELGSVQAILTATRAYPSYTFIQDYSYEVVKSWSHPLDLLFIDGSHHYEDVCRDLEDWLPLVVGGGVIALHDSTANRGGPYYWPGPSRLADELLEDARVDYLDSVHTVTAFTKASREKK